MKKGGEASDVISPSLLVKHRQSPLPPLRALDHQPWREWSMHADGASFTFAGAPKPKSYTPSPVSFTMLGSAALWVALLTSNCHVAAHPMPGHAPPSGGISGSLEGPPVWLTRMRQPRGPPPHAAGRCEMPL